ncbi:DUF4232 domain-containing protein [Nocardioides acrostichi]|uniref:DUF4232 domain-containing protein n=1 Tax=Nocardioides acrostichi TaxID=2784339 RepID=A0A930V2C8_9ACTN|nr:DUF4232 domain-containing protein [Nocardioides acrostichi]MBF4162450.1 DUF4232 domain-containing protein [Nocardioides acrostichi]
MSNSRLTTILTVIAAIVALGATAVVIAQVTSPDSSQGRAADTAPATPPVSPATTPAGADSSSASPSPSKSGASSESADSDSGSGSASSNDAAVPECENADLTASYAAGDAGAGHRYGAIRIENTSDHACTTGGFGGLSYVGKGDGTQVGAPATRDGDSDGAFVLDPGQAATSEVDEVVAQNYPKKKCDPVDVDGFRIYVPNSTKSQFVKHPTTGCLNSDIELISHQAFAKVR